MKFFPGIIYILFGLDLNLFVIFCLSTNGLKVKSKDIAWLNTEMKYLLAYLQVIFPPKRNQLIELHQKPFGWFLFGRNISLKCATNIG